MNTMTRHSLHHQPMRQQRGVTLIELMIGMTLGLFIVGGVLTVYIATVKSSGDTIKQSRLNQEMMTAMNIMANDIRRAGYWGNATPETVATNPFSASGNTILDVREASTNTTVNNYGSGASGDCITYAYDVDEDGSVDDDEAFGFKLVGNDIYMRTTCAGGTACSAAAGDVDDCAKGTWTRITDPDTVQVNTLTFDMADSICVNATVEDDTGTVTDENDCYANPPSSGQSSAEIRKIDIGLTAELVDDSLVDASMNISVRVRNDHVNVH